MPVTEAEFTSWSYRNGGETYGRGGSPGVAYRFPGTDVSDRVTRISETTYETVTEGRFFTTRSLHQHADSWIDDRDRLHIDTDDVRIVIDPSGRKPSGSAGSHPW